MKTFGCIKTITFCCTLCSSAVLADVAVIVNPTHSADISVEDIKGLYSGRQKNFADGKAALVLSLEDGDPTRSEFNNDALGKTDAQMKAYWSKLLFTGKGTPPNEVSPAEMLQVVASNPNTIGFVDAASVTGDVKVIATF